jgi:hypothetical protein
MFLKYFKFFVKVANLCRRKHIFGGFFSKMFHKICIICDKKNSGHMGRHLQHLESEGGSVWQAYLADLTHDGTIELESKGS